MRGGGSGFAQRRARRTALPTPMTSGDPDHENLSSRSTVPGLGGRWPGCCCELLALRGWSAATHRFGLCQRSGRAESRAIDVRILAQQTRPHRERRQGAASRPRPKREATKTIVLKAHEDCRRRSSMNDAGPGSRRGTTRRTLVGASTRSKPSTGRWPRDTSNGGVGKREESVDRMKRRIAGPDRPRSVLLVLCKGGTSPRLNARRLRETKNGSIFSGPVRPTPRKAR